MSNAVIDCSNCGIRNTPSCYASCEIRRKNEEIREAKKKALAPNVTSLYSIDNIRKNANKAAKRKRK